MEFNDVPAQGVLADQMCTDAGTKDCKTYPKYEVCPKSSWTSLVEVLDKHISLKAFAFHEVQHQLNKWSKFHEN